MTATKARLGPARKLLKLHPQGAQKQGEDPGGGVQPVQARGVEEPVEEAELGVVDPAPHGGRGGQGGDVGEEEEGPVQPEESHLGVEEDGHEGGEEEPGGHGEDHVPEGVAQGAPEEGVLEEDPVVLEPGEGRGPEEVHPVKQAEVKGVEGGKDLPHQKEGEGGPHQGPAVEGGLGLLRKGPPQGQGGAQGPEKGQRREKRGQKPEGEGRGPPPSPKQAPERKEKVPGPQAPRRPSGEKAQPLGVEAEGEEHPHAQDPVQGIGPHSLPEYSRRP